MVNDEQHKAFEAIIKLYDLAENLLETTFDPQVIDPEQHLDAIEPLIDHIAEATDNLVDEYTALVKEGKEFQPESKERLEMSLRTIHAAINECKKAIGE
jgi:superfamily I DNA/RNA helicase